MDKDFATILVGEQEVVFNIRRSRLNSSDFFKRALGGIFVERRGVVKLRDGDAAAFRHYVAWLTTSKLAWDEAKPCWMNPNFYKVLALADLIQDDSFYNHSIDVLVDDMQTKKTFNIALATRLYDILPESSPVIKLVVDVWVHGSGLDWWDNLGDSTAAPKEFWKAVAKEMRRLWLGHAIPTEFPWVKDRCKYHKHFAGISCSK